MKKRTLASLACIAAVVAASATAYKCLTKTKKGSDEDILDFLTKYEEYWLIPGGFCKTSIEKNANGVWEMTETEITTNSEAGTERVEMCKRPISDCEKRRIVDTIDDAIDSNAVLSECPGNGEFVHIVTCDDDEFYLDASAMLYGIPDFM